MEKRAYQAPQVVTMTAREVLSSLGHAAASVYAFGSGVGD
jgi:hypothetical protein